ncbi:MAG: FAD-dependent oxidoreductase [Pseudomonadota bacterium]
MSENYAIIGGGQAGLQAAVTLRQKNADAAIDLYCAEDCLPYQRPPLSKAYLKGEMAEDRLYFRPDDFFDSQNISVALSTRVSEVDASSRELTFESGEKKAYDKLLIATGAPPRRLSAPGADLEGVFYLRSLRDSDSLRPILETPGPIAIVGAGYIGLEVAAVMRAAGKEVVVLEMADRVLARVASEPVSAFFQMIHADAGVDLRLGAALSEIAGKGAVSGVVLSDGTEVPCSAVLIGIGAVPEIGIAEQAGLTIDNGIVVDDHARTSDETIWAAGDCTNFPSPRYGRRMRLESVPNAIEQGKAAALNMAGDDVVYDALPWFWSDQYDVKLQTVGLMEGFDELIVRGKPEMRKMSVWYFKGDDLLAVDAINDPAAFAVSKRALTNNMKIDRQKLPSEADLKSVLL